MINEANVQGQQRETPPREYPAELWVALIGIGALCLGVAVFAFQQFPNSGDEFSYLFQADLFASGRLSVPSEAEPLRTAFDVDHVLDDGTVRSKYPPGWPLLLAVGQALGAPVLIAPLLSAVAAFFLFAWLRKAVGVEAAWGGVCFFITSPFVILNGASYFSHTAGLALMAGAAWASLAHEKPRTLVAGLFCGGVFLCRPLDGLLLLVALAFGLFSARAAVKLAAGATPGLLAFLGYNHIQFGSAFTTGYEAYLPTFARLYPAEAGGDLALGHLQFAAEHLGWLGDLLLWSSPLIILVPLGFIVRERSASWRFAVCSLLLSCAAIFFMKSSAGDSYGPRYLYPCMVPLAYFAGLGVAHLLQHLQRKPALLCCAAVCAVALASGCDKINSAQNLIAARSNIYEEVRALDLKQAVVVIRRAPLFGAKWYARNDPDHTQEVLYVTAEDSAQLALLQAKFTDRAFYVYDAKKTPRLSRFP